jgi:hypothetical protein
MGVFWLISAALLGFGFGIPLGIHVTLRYLERKMVVPKAVSVGFANELNTLLPGEVFNLGVRGREFCIMEKEEFDLLLNKSGRKYRNSSRG